MNKITDNLVYMSNKKLLTEKEKMSKMTESKKPGVATHAERELELINREISNRKMKNSEAMDALFADPDYSNLNLSERELTVTLSEDEQATILTAYDRGLTFLREEQQEMIDHVISKLKDQIWP